METLSPQDYPVRHFSQMEQLSAALRSAHVQVLSHEYYYESFGSWSTTVRCGGNHYRLAFDGRDRTYSVDKLDNGQISLPIWQSEADKLPMTEIIAAVLSAAEFEE
jgi:hypothetical protein